ncbi:hypothetical protein MBLNU13_g09844t1 [Cladosporium sp. NU13]
MVSYTEARKKKEKFRKYRESIEAKAKKSVEHQAKIWILLERNGRFYPISYPKNAKAQSQQQQQQQQQQQHQASRPELDGFTNNQRSTFTLIEPVALRPSQLNGMVW